MSPDKQRRGLWSRNLRFRDLRIFMIHAQVAVSAQSKLEISWLFIKV